MRTFSYSCLLLGRTSLLPRGLIFELMGLKHKVQIRKKKTQQQQQPNLFSDSSQNRQKKTFDKNLLQHVIDD